MTGPLTVQRRAYIRYFFGGMQELGWIEGSSVAYEHALYPDRDLYAPADRAKMLEIASELVERKPDVIWLLSSGSAIALNVVNKTIPVVGAAVGDVVHHGLAISLARPGKNFTGISSFTWELGAKRFQLLHEIMPKLTRVGVLVHPKLTTAEHELIQRAAERARVSVVTAKMEYEDQTEAAFLELSKQRAEALLLPHFPLFQSSRKIILKFARQYAIPVVGHRTYFAEDGALMAYSTVLEEQMRRSAHLVHKILNGESPGDIPVEQPTRFEFVINRQVAKEYGLAIPPTLLVQADKIID